jgi:hypothetical protein
MVKRGLRRARHNKNNTRNLLGPWNEVIGKVEKIDYDSITLKCLRTVTIQIPPDTIEAWRRTLHSGSKIGVLMLNDGKFKVRTIRDHT